MQLWLSEKIYKSDKITVYGLAAYCAIKTLLHNDEQKEICTNADILSYQLIKNIQPPRRFLERIKTGYEELLEQGIINKVGTNSKYDVLDCSNLFITEGTDYFTIITYEEVLRIFQIKNVNNLILLKYFIFLIGTISSTIDVYLDPIQHKCRVVGNLTIDYISQLSGIGTTSIIEYNKILEKENLIYVYRQYDFIINEENGEITTLPNVYGRSADKVYIDTYATNQKKYKNSYKYVENNVKGVNERRRLAQMYNQLRKGNDSKYSPETIQQIYNYVLQENQKYQKVYEKTQDKLYLNKIRDIGVFEKYGY